MKTVAVSSLLVLACFACFAGLACSGSSSNGVPGPHEGGPSDGTTSSTSPAEPAEPGESSAEGAEGAEGDPAKSDHGKADPQATAPPGAAADCKAYATAYCAKAVACGHLVAKITGLACEARMAGICEAHVASPGTGYTPAALATCTTAYPALTCADAFAEVAPAACTFVGTLPLGAECAFHDQCATGGCSASATECGKCVVATKSTPAPKADLGEACDEAGKDAPDCNSQFGLWCDGVTKKCAEITTAALGESCGYLGGMIVMCASGGACKPGTTGSGTCVGEKAVSESCSASVSYGECAFGTSCIGGKCAIPTAAAICK